jgi:hypothetical protein
MMARLRSAVMTGRITGLIYDQRFGAIAGEDGVDYTFDSRSLIGVTFGMLHVGVSVTFVPDAATKRAAGVQIEVNDVERLR